MAESPNCILLALDAEDTPATTPALEFAAVLAKQHEARVTSYILPPAIQVPVSWTASSAKERLASEEAKIHARMSATARFASRYLAQAGIECLTEMTTSPFQSRTERFVQLARVNDLTLLDALSGDPARRGAIEDALFDSGRPIVILPPSSNSALPRRVAIAWDGSSRSARAVDGGLVFLTGADAVFIVTVTGEKDLTRMAPGADLAGYLARHGVADPQLATLAVTKGDVGGRLRKFIADEEIDLMVMGAFAHARFRQAVLGGVTWSFLDDTPLPLLMAH
ncbi:universal stress protein [Mesorhizobium xinjiangense]|uniref:universal stress protein n=1 Tax=Mesorhizobium xinjiangense TaxID=2678685 RepID=UPI0012ED5B14|nr:universal stress protein [Mesorhizobium xinjiangense]